MAKAPVALVGQRDMHGTREGGQFPRTDMGFSLIPVDSLAAAAGEEVSIRLSL